MLIKDLRYAVRTMRRDLPTTIAAVVVLALGIGSATIVFSLANGLLIRPLPYAQANRIMGLQESSAHNSERGCCQVSFQDYESIRVRTRLLRTYP